MVFTSGEGQAPSSSKPSMEWSGDSSPCPVKKCLCSTTCLRSLRGPHEGTSPLLSGKRSPRQLRCATASSLPSSSFGRSTARAPSLGVYPASVSGESQCPGWSPTYSGHDGRAARPDAGRQTPRWAWGRWVALLPRGGESAVLYCSRQAQWLVQRSSPGALASRDHGR